MVSSLIIISSTKIGLYSNVLLLFWDFDQKILF